jgi:NitT/TauT family transport system substrate-binding protein
MRTTWRWCLAACAALIPFRPGPAPAEEIVVSHYADLMYGTPWAVALKKGFLKARGVDVTGFVSSDGGGTTIRNIMAGGLPYAEVALSAAVGAIQDGIPLRIVDGAVNNAADLVWVVLPGSKLQSIKDMAGHKLAFTRAKSTTELFAILCLRAAGVDPATVTRLPLGTMGGGLTAMVQGAVDAAPELEPLVSRNEGKYRILFSAADILPPITQHVGVASADFLRDHPDTVRALILARQDGVAYIYAHPDEAAEIEAEALDIPVPVAKRAIRRLVAAHYWSDGRLDYDAMARSVAGLHAIGAFPTAKVDWSAMVDESALPSELRSVPGAVKSGSNALGEGTQSASTLGTSIPGGSIPGVGAPASATAGSPPGGGATASASSKP